MFPLCPILAALLTNCADVARSVFSRQTGDSFALTGQVFVRDNNNDPVLNMTDATGSMRVMGVRHVIMPLPFKSGDTIHVTGVIDLPPDIRTRVPCAICRSARFVANGKPPPPVRVSGADILSGRYDCRLVRTRGRIRRIIRDEIDPGCLYMPFVVDGDIVHVTLRQRGDSSIEATLRELIDAEIEVVGLCMPSAYMTRRFIGYTLQILGRKDITVVKPASEDPYDAPPLDVNMVADMSTIGRLGRHRLAGTVLAVCADRRAVLQTDGGDIVDVNLIGEAEPSCGSRIEVVGIPEADYYQINLVDAIWRNAPGSVQRPASPCRIEIEQLLTDGKGHERFPPQFHGKIVQTHGTLIDIPKGDFGHGFAILKDTGGTVLLDMAYAGHASERLSVGCRIDVTGVCVVNMEASTAPLQRFQRVNGITIVVRDPKDIVVLSRPPWWTPQRLSLVVAALLLVLVSIFIWNRSLQLTVDRKSRQFLREHAAHIKATLRVDERTRLAVELHDSLSQNLSGVACQIAATKGTLPDGADETARYLSTAERMLLSCRTELRRCLWDLREDALAEKDFSEAIRKTLAPVVNDAELHVRFDVPRARMEDTTAHAILCIIRELASNAVRHGHARHVQIVGELRDKAISISVDDDGRGFEPSTAAGAAEGHFGIEGIRERVKRLNGSFSIASEPRKGCDATVSIPLKVKS